MFCPKCGLERVSTETSFCSRCGFLLTGTADLLLTGGLIPQLPASMTSQRPSPRSRGLKQGLFIFLLTFLIVPLIAIITVGVNAEPYAVVIASILLVVGGLLRMAYAVMFESAAGGPSVPNETGTNAQPFLNRQSPAQALPSQQTYPAQAYTSPAGNWRDTNELMPQSVTEGTTKLLEKDEI